MAENVSVAKSSQFIHGGYRITIYDSATEGSTTVTATHNSSDLTNRYGRGANIYLQHTPATTGALTITLQAKSPSGDYINIPDAGFAARTSSGTAMITVYPGLTNSTNAIISNVIPLVWRAVFTH